MSFELQPNQHPPPPTTAFGAVLADMGDMGKRFHGRWGFGGSVYCVVLWMDKIDARQPVAGWLGFPQLKYASSVPTGAEDIHPWRSKVQPDGDRDMGPFFCETLTQVMQMATHTHTHNPDYAWF